MVRPFFTPFPYLLLLLVNGILFIAWAYACKIIRYYWWDATIILYSVVNAVIIDKTVAHINPPPKTATLGLVRQ